MTPPRVALTRWENVVGERIEAYRRRLRSAGLEPVDFVDPTLSLDGCAGLVLSGGIDVDPGLYGEARQAETQAPNHGRDEFELRLLRTALEADLPVLAICRGHQLLNVCFGGRLLQHIESGEHDVADDAPVYTSAVHVVTLERGSRLREALDASEVLVNSRHHQAVRPGGLAAGLCATGTTPDGLVEAVESERHTWVVGVQWHPERTEPQIEGFESASVRIFQAFARAVQGG